jgi:hypothetical protein
VTSTISRPTISTLAFSLTAQGVLGHVIGRNETRARALLAEMSAEHLDSLTAAANTMADLAAGVRPERMAASPRPDRP